MLVLLIGVFGVGGTFSGGGAAEMRTDLRRSLWIGDFDVAFGDCSNPFGKNFGKNFEFGAVVDDGSHYDFVLADDLVAVLHLFGLLVAGMRPLVCQVAE